MCENGEQKDVGHLLVMYGEVESDWWVLTDEVSRFVGTGEWLDVYGRVCKEGNVALLFGKGMEGVRDTVMEEVRECVMYCIGKWWQRRKTVLYWELIEGFLSPPLPPL